VQSQPSGELSATVAEEKGEIASKPSEIAQDFGDITTETMDSRCSIDDSISFNSMVDDLLAGDGSPEELIRYLARILHDTRPIASTKGFVDTPSLGTRRWVAYRGDRGGVCRAALSCSIDQSGDGDDVSFDGPIPRYRIANAPQEMASTSLRLRIHRSRDGSVKRGWLELALIPDSKEKNKFVKSQISLLRFQAHGSTGKSIEFTKIGDDWVFVNRSYAIATDDGSFAEPDIDWRGGHRMRAELDESIGYIGSRIKTLVAQ
jgi:hypothetical protein